MTNETIEKRFLFDLEMGIFNIRKIRSGKVVIFKSLASDQKRYKLIKVLEKLGYTSDDNFNIDQSEFDSIISVYLNVKNFILMPIQFIIEDINEFDEIPEYIDEYKTEGEIA